MPDVMLMAGWADMDSNAHMRNTAYLDKAVDARMLFFTEMGFPATEFERLRLGPVVMRDEVEYFLEIRMLEALRVTLELCGLSADGSRFRLRNEFYRHDGRLTARVTSTGGWLDLALRKLTAPPDPIVAALRSLPRAECFEDLPSSLK
jgi:acyl-CoA thioester hydrolase